MNGGIPSEDTLIQLAPQFNMSREQLGAVVKSVTEKFYSQAYYTVQGLDTEVNPADVLEYACTTYDSEKLMDIQRGIFAGDLSGVKDLVNHYNSRNISMSKAHRLVDVGWQFYQEGAQTFCEHPVKGKLTIQEAMKSGLFK